MGPTGQSLGRVSFHGILKDDVEYILSTFTATGYLDPGDRDVDGGKWRHGGCGEGVLSAYDEMSRRPTR